MQWASDWWSGRPGFENACDFVWPNDDRILCILNFFIMIRYSWHGFSVFSHQNHDDTFRFVLLWIKQTSIQLSNLWCSKMFFLRSEIFFSRLCFSSIGLYIIFPLLLQCFCPWHLIIAKFQSSYCNAHRVLPYRFDLSLIRARLLSEEIGEIDQRYSDEDFFSSNILK